MEPGGSLPHSQEPATCPYPASAQSSPCPPPHPTSWRSIFTFHVPKLISLFRSCGRPKEPVQLRGLSIYFVTSYFFLRWGVVSTSPNPQAGGPPLVGCVRDSLFNVFATTLHNWRPFLDPQPEDAPCRGDRGPLNTEFVVVRHVNIGVRIIHVFKNVVEWIKYRSVISISFPIMQPWGAIAVKSV
jgi:hypothetical protein